MHACRTVHYSICAWANKCCDYRAAQGIVLSSAAIMVPPPGQMLSAAQRHIRISESASALAAIIVQCMELLRHGALMALPSTWLYMTGDPTTGRCVNIWRSQSSATCRIPAYLVPYSTRHSDVATPHVPILPCYLQTAFTPICEGV